MSKRRANGEGNIHKVSLPAQFEVWYDEEMHAWLGELAENPTILQSGKPHSSKKK